MGLGAAFTFTSLVCLNFSEWKSSPAFLLVWFPPLPACGWGLLVSFRWEETRLGVGAQSLVPRASALWWPPERKVSGAQRSSPCSPTEQFLFSYQKVSGPPVIQTAGLSPHQWGLGVQAAVSGQGQGLGGLGADGSSATGR